MATATITVTCSGGVVSTTPTTITGPGDTQVDVMWAPGTGVATITNVSTPTGPAGTLGPPTLNAGVWSMWDELGTISETYDYTVTITTSPQEGSKVIHHDPEIVNNPTT